MKLSTRLRTQLAACAITLPLIAQASEEVRIYNWSDYIHESAIADFEKKTSIEVIYDVFDSDEILEAKLLAGNSGYDIVFPSANFMARQIQAGIFQPLQKDKIPNKTHIWDFVANNIRTYDTEDKYSVNYMWGTTGLGINAEKIKAIAPNAPLDSWELVFNPKYAEKVAECGIYMLDAPDDMIPAVLNYQGKDPDSKNRDDIKGTKATLDAIRPYIKQFSNSSFIDALANGDICLAVGYSGDIMQAADRAAEAENGIEVSYVIPKEGAKLWFDQMVIPSDAPNVDNAHQFINYILEPKVIAKASNYLFYANGNKDAAEFMDKEILEDTAIYPDKATAKNLYTTTIFPPRIQRTVTRLWTNVKAGK